MTFGRRHSLRRARGVLTVLQMNGKAKLMSFKILKVILWIFFFCILVAVIGLQYKAESYKKEINQRYGFYINRKRISYKPFFVFYLKSKGFSDSYYNIYWDTINLPYEEKELLRNGYTLLYNIQYNAYLMYCFYDRKELELYQIQKRR